MVIGVRSDGFTITVFPQAKAYGKNQNGIMPGKLNGAMIATTPNGCRIMNSSIPRAISSNRLPCIIVGIPHATSTFSIARRISPWASFKVFPFSFTIVSDRSLKWNSSRFFSSNRVWIRSGAGMLRQTGYACCAARAARSTSARRDRGTWQRTSFVAGLWTGSEWGIRRACPFSSNIVLELCRVFQHATFLEKIRFS